MNREEQRLWFQASARLGRASDEIAFLRDELAKETARRTKMADLIASATKDLVSSRITIGGKFMRINPNCVLVAARKLTDAVKISDAVVPSHQEQAIDLTEVISTLNSDGAIA